MKNQYIGQSVKQFICELMEVKALAAQQHMTFTEFLHRMFLNELDRHREIKVLES
jgi:hypothetical protein